MDEKIMEKMLQLVIQGIEMVSDGLSLILMKYQDQIEDKKNNTDTREE